MSQAEDISAINDYMVRSQARTPQAGTIQQDWRQWYGALSWLQKNAYNNTLLDAKAKRDAFNRANGSTVIQATPSGQSQVVSTVPYVAPGSHPTIKKGSSGQPVKDWQPVVKALPVDGKFGPNTDTLTRNWQKARGLVADGIVGPATWSRAIAESQSAQQRPQPVASAAHQAAATIAKQQTQAAAVKAQAAKKPAAIAAQKTAVINQVAVAAAKPTPKPAITAPKPVAKPAPITAKPKPAIVTAVQAAAAAPAQAVIAAASTIGTTAQTLPVWGKIAALTGLGLIGFMGIHEAMTRAEPKSRRSGRGRRRAA